MEVVGKYLPPDSPKEPWPCLYLDFTLPASGAARLGGCFYAIIYEAHTLLYQSQATK